MGLHRGFRVETGINQGKEELAAEGSFQAGQTAKALSGYRVQSLPEGHGRQRYAQT